MMEYVLRYKKLIKRMIPQKTRAWFRVWAGRRLAAKIAAQRDLRREYLWGVNLYGNVSAASGLAEAARGVQRGTERAGVPLCVKDLGAETELRSAAPYRINLIHTNPDLMLEPLLKIPQEQWLGRYNIGFWVWEQEELPREWAGFLPLFDEIWTPSEFCASAIRASCTLPVTVIPHIVEPVCDTTCVRAEMGLPEDVFLFLVMFDNDSVSERKNPWGVIRAFRQAFEGKDEKVGLVIKARNLDDRTRKKLQEQLKGCPYVWLLEGDYSKKTVNSLIRMSDVYVSLHRAEGFGLVPAEAMYLGTPVIATNWSANTEFMNEDTACLVDAELVRLEKDILPYRKGSRWAQPNLEQAAGYMRRLYEDEEYRTGLTQRAGVYIRERLSTERIAQLLSARLTEIKRELDGHVIPDADDPLL